MRRLLAYFRVMIFGWGAGLAQGYAARFYDVGPLSGYARPIAEMGRFCLAPGGVHPDVLRLAWGAMTRLVDEAGAGLMVGCSSFRGHGLAAASAALALLAQGHIGPAAHLPGKRRMRLCAIPHWSGPVQDRRAALAGLPPLLRTYLGMGGWVSDHAVVDRGPGHPARLYLCRGGQGFRRPRAKPARGGTIFLRKIRAS